MDSAGKGTRSRQSATLTKLCKIWPTESGDYPWNMNLEVLPPGTKTSVSHAHSHEDESLFMLRGKARYWHHGTVPEPILTIGDYVGWKAGTGIAHNVINDGD